MLYLLENSAFCVVDTLLVDFLNSDLLLVESAEVDSAIGPLAYFALDGVRAKSVTSAQVG